MSGEHLNPTKSSRGFSHMPEIPSQYGGSIRAYESSAACEPCLWIKIECPESLNDPDGPRKEAVVHLTVGDAAKFRDQLDVLIDDHYQNPDEYYDVQ